VTGFLASNYLRFCFLPLKLIALIITSCAVCSWAATICRRPLQVINSTECKRSTLFHHNSTALLPFDNFRYDHGGIGIIIIVVVIFIIIYFTLVQLISN